MSKYQDIYTDPFEEYIRQKDSSASQKAYAWQTAIGLQDVDKLKTSDYLIETARKNIEGKIDFAEVSQLIDSYYEENQIHSSERTDEADKVSVRIAEILSDNSFVFSPAQYTSIHRHLFHGIYSHAGKIRDYNISKKEWVLNGASVHYGNARDLRETLEYDFQMEKRFSYEGLSMEQTISHLAHFVAYLWQIHVFGEGNTRTTAVFFIKYLRTLGFNATNDIFAKNAWYFRNALVRANYTDVLNGIYEDASFLEKFLRNLLLGESNPLRNRETHIFWKTAHSNEKQHIDQHITKKNDTLEKILATLPMGNVSRKHILLLYKTLGTTTIFGRKDVMRILSLTERPSTTLIGKMKAMQLIVAVDGYGKGKYQFIALEEIP